MDWCQTMGAVKVQMPNLKLSLGLSVGVDFPVIMVGLP